VNAVFGRPGSGLPDPGRPNTSGGDRYDPLFVLDVLLAVTAVEALSILVDSLSALVVALPVVAAALPVVALPVVAVALSVVATEEADVAVLTLVTTEDVDVAVVTLLAALPVLMLAVTESEPLVPGVPTDPPQPASRTPATTLTRSPERMRLPPDE